MLRNLQIWHVLWLALTPVLFALFRLSSEPHDADRALVDNLFVLGGAVWVACVAVYFVITGKKEDALPGLLRLYRGLLGKMWFLWLSNIAGTILMIVFAYKLACFRQVEFVSATTVELHLNDIPGEDVLVGILREKTPSSFRLPVGTRHLVFQEVGSGKKIESATFFVPSLAQQPGKVRTSIAPQKEHEYEKVR